MVTEIVQPQISPPIPVTGDHSGHSEPEATPTDPPRRYYVATRQYSRIITICISFNFV
jgi:hypothetical protein